MKILFYNPTCKKKYYFNSYRDFIVFFNNYPTRECVQTSIHMHVSVSCWWDIAYVVYVYELWLCFRFCYGCDFIRRDRRDYYVYITWDRAFLGSYILWISSGIDLILIVIYMRAYQRYGISSWNTILQK